MEFALQLILAKPIKYLVIIGAHVFLAMSLIIWVDAQHVLPTHCPTLINQIVYAMLDSLQIMGTVLQDHLANQIKC
jgi:hypothetical protein